VERFVATSLVTARLDHMSSQLTWLPAWAIRNLISERQVSPVEVVDHFLGRIAEHDGMLRAFKSIDEQGAREQAKRAETALVRGDELGPLHGVPVSVKEYIPVEGLPRRDSNGVDWGVSKRDGLGVARLRRAGAVIVGTNTAMGITQALLNPYNCEDEARNPWDTSRVTGWSSSGGGAAAAAALVPIAIGNDGGGSTRLPAAGAGVVGLHPTPGRVPEVSWDVPKLPALTTSSGPLCRNVVDAAITLQVMAGPDGRDFTGMKTDPSDYVSRLGAGVDGMRFAWTDDLGFAGMYALAESSRVIETIRESAMGLASLGATVEPVAHICDDFWDDYCITNYLFQIAMEVPEPTRDEWVNALDGRQRTWSAFRQVLADNDAVLCPTTQLLPRSVEDWGSAWLRDASEYPHGTFAPTVTCDTHIFNWIGFPAVSVPCGFVDGLPVGLQIVGLPGSEDKLLRVANAFQVAFPHTMAQPPL
jgi:aspartyl-tRNA(Asn)/glutamyl-tRNA(Gln) amidotransferase subunit A